MSSNAPHSAPPPEEQLNNGPERHGSIVDFLRDIKNGVLDPKGLSTDDRRVCVAHLMGESLSVGEISQVLQVSPRTITRDRQAIHEQNAIEPDPQLTALLAGRLVTEYEATTARIRRVTRDKETPPAAKIDGEYKCYDMLDRLMQRLQSMGYLPTAAQQIRGELTHNLGDLSSIAGLREEIQRIEKIEQEIRATPAPATASAELLPPAPKGDQ